MGLLGLIEQDKWLDYAMIGSGHLEDPYSKGLYGTESCTRLTGFDEWLRF